MELVAGAGGRRLLWFVKLLGHPQTGEGCGGIARGAIARVFSMVRLFITA